MDFNEFVDYIRDNIADYLLQYDIEKIHVEQVVKNNNVKMTGMAILVKGERMAPNIYLESYYQTYSMTDDMDYVLGKIRDNYNKARLELDENMRYEGNMFDVSNIFIKVVNYERNKEMLKDCPYIKVQDLAITFRGLLRMDNDGMASAIVRYDDMEKINFDGGKAELFEIAKENTERLLPPTIRRLTDMMSEMLDMDEAAIELPGDYEMYVITNEKGINGASAMFYDGILDKAKAMLGDCYILPSSIHEVILLPKTEDIMLDELKEMVEDINKYVVEDMDYLSDSVYEYDEKEKQLKIAGPGREKEREQDFER